MTLLITNLAAHESSFSKDWLDLDFERVASVSERFRFETEINESSWRNFRVEPKKKFAETILMNFEFVWQPLIFVLSLDNTVVVGENHPYLDATYVIEQDLGY